MIQSYNFTRSNREKSNIGKMNDWMATLLFRILVVAIIFSPALYKIYYGLLSHMQK